MLNGSPTRTVELTASGTKLSAFPSDRSSEQNEFVFRTFGKPDRTFSDL